MNTPPVRLAPTPLALCLAAALGLGSISAFADPGVASPVSIPTSGSAPIGSASGRMGFAGLRHFDALRLDDAALVPSRVTGAGVMLRAPLRKPMAVHAPKARGAIGHARSNAHPFATSERASFVAGSVVVTNCQSNGPGSLAEVIATAPSATIVDMTQLTCGEIDALNGLVLYQDSLTLKGPGADKLTLTTSKYSGVLTALGTGEYVCEVRGPLGSCLYGHYEGGLLVIEGLTIAGGTIPENNAFVKGGCIYSNGDLELRDSVVSGCHVNVAGSPDFQSKGGGVFTDDDLRMYNSRITDCYIAARSGLRARGGGAYVGGDLTMHSSSIDHNTAFWYGVAGGAWVQGNDGSGSLIDSSSVSNNYAYAVGGLFLGRLPSYDNVFYPYETFIPSSVISNSTIGNNTAPQFIGGIKTYSLLELMNSTIAGNMAGLHFHAASGTWIDAGVFFDNQATEVRCTYDYYYYADCDPYVVSGVRASSTLIAGNQANGSAADISGIVGSVDGHHNFIDAAHVPVPDDTLIFGPAGLGLLGLHGGKTDSFSLLPGSPAIDAGITYSDGYDQRGVGFPRESGAALDIGAFEAQQAQLVISTNSVEFGAVSIGASADMTLTVSNGGDLPLQVLGLAAPAEPFQQGAGTCTPPPFTLDGRASCTVIYRFLPSVLGDASQTLLYTSDAYTPGANGNIVLHGVGINDRIFGSGFDP